ncbi:outer membrane beta-barrel protein [Mucilaginibacter antarcticus]|uniref:outer membrane beta-barrel protein n=1 Tax=Mucilaginibacter antarcticus TaxID=1855725 RepID=UPI00362E3C22
MRYILTSLILIFLLAGNSYAQTGRGVSGQLIDSTKQSLPGSTVKLKTDLGDSTTLATDVDGKFNFSNIKGTKIKLYISSFGYEAVIKNYSFSPDDNKAFVIPPITLKGESRTLKEVTIVGVNPIKFKEDTIDYKISAYPVRENAPVEDVLKKMPGVEVDAAGNVTTQGKSVTKIRINGKDFMGGDVQSATKNLPADILESVQIIDDYGDQANLTGVRTGEPNKILNFVIRNDKNYGYSLQATAGAGRDLLPENAGIENNERYTGSVNFFNFKGNRQITVLGNINNTNTNTFNFGGGGGNRGGGGGGGPRGGGGGGGGGAGVSNRDGITIARAIGTNYRDQWGQFISVYGSYSFSNNSTFTQSSTLRTNSGQGTTNTSQSSGTDNPENHRFNFNLEYKPDTVNYLKVSPSFSYAASNANFVDDILYRTGSTLTRAYTTTTRSNSIAPNFSINALYNHRFAKQGRNFSFFVNGGVSKSRSASNPIIDATVGAPNVPRDQRINSDNRNQTFGGTASWLEPIGKVSYLELSYSYNYSKTSNNKETDSVAAGNEFVFIPKLSNDFNFSFITNKFGLNYRVIETNYNYTLGLAVQPSVLEGRSSLALQPTKKNQFNYIPAARFLYNFSRNQSLSINYNGTSQQPSFTQLQPVLDLSNASYPVRGNENLEQSFNNNFFVRYNSFGIESGNTLFLNASFNKTDNYIATRTTSYGNLSTAVLTANPALRDLTNTTLTRYQNADGYMAGGLQAFSQNHGTNVSIPYHLTPTLTMLSTPVMLTLLMPIITARQFTRTLLKH